jgi:hypothetical protein
MRHVMFIAAASLLALTACQKKPSQAPAAPGAAPTGATAPAAAPASGPPAMPERTPGLWEQKMSVIGHTQVMQLCLDKAVAQRFSMWGQHANREGCSEAKVTPRLGGGWDFASSCDMGENGKTSTSGTVTGDFAKSYKLSAKSTVTGARTAAMNGTTEMTLEATWKGPCPAGMQPGDMIMPGGMKINMAQAHAR